MNSQTAETAAEPPLLLNGTRALSAPAVMAKRRRLLLATLGTRGDVQPKIALAKALRADGYEVTLAAPPNFADWVGYHDLPYEKLGVDMQAWLSRPDVVEQLTRSQFSQLFNIGKLFNDLMPTTMADLVDITRSADAMLFNPMIHYGVDAAESRKIPCALTALQPMTPTTEFPAFIAPGEDLGSTLNWLSWKFVHLGRIIDRGKVKAWRRDALDLPHPPRSWRPGQINGATIPRIYGFSEHVIPRPADWEPYDRITGFWVLQNAQALDPDPALVRFLADGPPPIYIGFGSMPVGRTDEKRDILVEAVKASGQRALIARGWAGIEAAAEASDGTILSIGSVPHDWLFPQCAGVVHHGGAGTLATGLRAACPTLVCPIIVDQPLWGYQIARLGAGPRPIRVQKWTVEGLAAAFRDLATNAGYRDVARGISAGLLSEDGLARGVAEVRAAIGEP